MIIQIREYFTLIYFALRHSQLSILTLKFKNSEKHRQKPSNADNLDYQ